MVTCDDLQRIFDAAIHRVYGDAWHRYVSWTVSVSAQRYSFDRWVKERHAWCLSDPEWLEAIMVSKLEGKW